MRRIAVVALLVAALGLPARAAEPTLWISPPASDGGRCLRELFEHPDGWQETRPLVDTLFYTDLNFNTQFTDAELRAWFSELSRWHITLALEVGAVKEWGTTGDKTFHDEQPIWDRIQRLGGHIRAIALDEPLTCVRQSLHKPDDYAVQETANYIALVRRHYPQIAIGDIEPYPSISLADHQWWIGALQQRLAGLGVRGLDFYRLDVDWVNFVAAGRGSWTEVKALEQHCRAAKLPFSLIYWAADYPQMKNRGLADDSTWYVSLMQQGYDYALVGGTPDQYVIESWVGAPSHSVPETADGTFTRSVRDFARRFVRRFVRRSTEPTASPAQGQQTGRVRPRPRRAGIGPRPCPGEATGHRLCDNAPERVPAGRVAIRLDTIWMRRSPHPDWLVDGAGPCQDPVRLPKWGLDEAGSVCLSREAGAGGRPAAPLPPTGRGGHCALRHVLDRHG